MVTPNNFEANVTRLYHEASEFFNRYTIDFTTKIGLDILEGREEICNHFKSFGVRMQPEGDILYYDMTGYLYRRDPCPGLIVYRGPFDPQIINFSQMRKG